MGQGAYFLILVDLDIDDRTELRGKKVASCL